MARRLSFAIEPVRSFSRKFSGFRSASYRPQCHSRSEWRALKLMSVGLQTGSNLLLTSMQDILPVAVFHHLQQCPCDNRHLLLRQVTPVRVLVLVSGAQADDMETTNKLRFVLPLCFAISPADDQVEQLAPCAKLL